MLYLSHVRSGLTVFIVALTSTSIMCTSPTEGRIERREADRNRNGRNETFTYWAGYHVVRIEVDQDEDGKIDRWEHFDATSKMIRVGSSSRDDATEDTWSYPDAGGFISRVEFDTDRNGIIDRREIYAPLPESPQRRVLSIVELDLDRNGKPGRRLHYKADGSFERSEMVR